MKHQWRPSPHTFGGIPVRKCAACGVNEVGCETEDCPMNKDQHLTSVELDDHLYLPFCECGWTGEATTDHDVAYGQADRHRQDMHERAIEAAERMMDR